MAHARERNPRHGLPLDLQSLRERVRAGESFKYLYFWGHTKRRPGGSPGAECCSQWYSAPFVIDGVRYSTAEHWMMCCKARLFSDAETIERILVAGSPAAAKALGRQVKGYEDERWAARRFSLVVEGNVAKFGQNAVLKEFLLNTGNRILVEASPRDRIWGIGLGAERADAVGPLGWRGQNLLGFALVAARARLTS